MDVAKKRILYAEDDKHIREAMTEMLQKQGYEVVAVDSARAGIAKAQSETFDLVLTNCEMEEASSGLELVKAARQRHPNIPILMLRDFDYQEEEAFERELKQAGGTALLNKTQCKGGALIRYIGFKLDTSFSVAAGVTAVREGTASGKPKLLLVDHDTSRLNEAAARFEAKGFEVMKTRICWDQKIVPDSDSSIHCLPYEEIQRIALSSDHSIDAIVTCVAPGEGEKSKKPYGVQLAHELQDTFHGPLAVYGPLDKEDKFFQTMIEESGGVGYFTVGEWDAMADALKEKLAAKGTSASITG